MALRRWSKQAALAAVICTAEACSSPALNRAPKPSLVLWAWERPESFPRLEDGIAIAYLSQTITLTQQHFDVTPRRQPLQVDPSTLLIAVTRIEAASTPLADDDAAVDAVAAVVARSAARPGVIGVQVDFDATATQREFYRALLARLRGTLAGTSLSMTALASWCVGDPWLADVGIPEIVPMLFRFDAPAHLYAEIAAASNRARPECRTAVGTSLDEPLIVHAQGRRVYVFNPKPWTAESIAEAKRRVRS